MYEKAKQLSARRHARVSHISKNGQIMCSMVPYYNDHGWGTVQDKVTFECWKMKLQGPVHMLESGSGARMNVFLYD